MELAEAIARFRELAEATTTASIPHSTAPGLPFFGVRGLRQIEKERKARSKRGKKKCRGYDPECRDKEWEVKAPVGGVALLRRSPVGG